MNGARIDLLCDGGGIVGFGHVRRTLTLADELRSRGHRVSISAISTEATRLIPPQPPFTDEADVLVVDAHEGVADAIVAARAEGKMVVALDWFGDVEPDVAVVVYPHAAVRARLQVFVGYEYYMLRPEILAQQAASDGEGAVIALGGGDVLRQAHAAAQGLATSGMDVTVIQGPLATPEGPRGPYRVVNNPPDFPASFRGVPWLSPMREDACLRRCILGDQRTCCPNPAWNGLSPTISGGGACCLASASNR